MDSTNDSLKPKSSWCVRAFKDFDDYVPKTKYNKIVTRLVIFDYFGFDEREFKTFKLI